MSEELVPSEIEEIQLPEKIKVALGNLLAQRQNLENQIGLYCQGIIDGMGLEGNWNLDTDKWVLTKVSEAETPKEPRNPAKPFKKGAK